MTRVSNWFPKSGILRTLFNGTGIAVGDDNQIVVTGAPCRETRMPLERSHAFARSIFKQRPLPSSFQSQITLPVPCSSVISATGQTAFDWVVGERLTASVEPLLGVADSSEATDTLIL